MPAISKYKTALIHLCMLLALLGVCTSPMQAGENDSTLKIATYNVQWFLDEYHDPYSQTLAFMRPKAQGDITKIANTIREMNADVVALEEIENTGVLKEVVAKHLSDMGYKYIHVEQTNSGVGQHIGVLSKKPIVSTTSYRFVDVKLPHDRRTWRFARDLVKVTIQATADKTMDIYMVHFKSKRDGKDDKNSNAYRLAEALTVRKIIADRLAAEPEAWVVLTGDFNDTPDSPPLRSLTAGPSPLLSDPHQHLPEAQRISYLKHPYRSIIDFTLVSDALTGRVVTNKTGVLAYETSNPQNIDGSDHTPVFVTINID